MSIISTRTLYVVRISRRKFVAFDTWAEASAYRDATLHMRAAGWVK